MPFKKPVVRHAHHPEWSRRAAVLTAGVVLLLFGVVFSQPIFAPPVNLGPKINTAGHEFDPFLTFDGKKLFFVSLRDHTESIWFSEWTGSDWTNPIKLGPQINAGASQKLSPSLSPDGQKLFYVDDSRQGFLWDIWVSTWDSSVNDWGNPVRLPYPVNTPGAEFSARIGPDGRHLYFNSEGDSGRCGIYVSEWDGANWSIPIKVSISSCSIDDYPSITADGQWFYFDRYLVDSGKSVFVSPWTGSDWGLPYDLRPQLGGGGTAFVTPSGESLFFASVSLTGFGGADIWMAQRVLRGDLNFDRQMTAADIVLELNKVFLDEAFPAAVADVNCDGLFTAADVVLLLNRVFISTPFPCDIGGLGKSSICVV